MFTVSLGMHDGMLKICYYLVFTVQYSIIRKCVKGLVLDGPKPVLDD